MTPERWREIERIYHDARARDAGTRAAFIAEACGGDAALRREVESLLAHDQTAERALGTAAFDVAALRLTGDSDDGTPTGSSRRPRLSPGQQFGPYRIERLLGRGGMGEVYEAEHVEHGRRIALKVLRQSLSDATDRARFLREGQLAASVTHPHTVYVYGSEEIAEIPVIAMELLRGGTLKDRVEEKGPLAPTEAIDAILQVVSGLEAAQAAGVLHRDIKPSNCFVDTDGTVKIGDFGLSIPTLTRDMTQLTTTGGFQGTPQFASPEQLRAAPLDVRSDIYAVGATLYYLLTGRSPIDDRDLMALVSRIATELPPSPREARPEIPRALAAVVLHCLEKDPAHRPANYRVLKSLLGPLGSTIRTPAPLGIRFAAGVIDLFFSAFLLVSPAFVLFARPSSAFGTGAIVVNLAPVAYFAITEGLWGASLGKALSGLRVVTEKGARPRFGQALVRALVFGLPPWVASGLAVVSAGLVYGESSGSITAFVVQTAVTALLFVSARRANGLAGIHELVSHTRTVLKSPVQVRGVLQSVPSPIEVLPSQRWVGPYRLIDNSLAQTNCGAALGYDERLRRTVWLRFPEVDSDPVPLARRILPRASRPRWLAGQRTSELAWDAYEQVPGQPFDTLVTRAQPWGTVREWLCDLAAEVDAGIRDGSLPALDLDRVWIGDDGRARLLDWPAGNGRPDSGSSPPLERSFELPHAQRFLHRVAASALEGELVADNHGHVRAPHVPLPLPAAECLTKLGEQRFTTSGELLAAVMSAARGPAAISRTRRAAHLSLCATPTIFMLVMSWLSLYLQLVVVPHEDVARRNIADLAACLDWLAVLQDRGVQSTNPQYRALNVYIAGHHRDLISSPSTWSAPLLEHWELGNQRRALAERVIATRPNPQKDDLDEAVRTLRPFLDDVRSGAEKERATTENFIWRSVWLDALAGLMVAGTLGLFSALAGRGGLALRLMGVAVVTKIGTPISGSRVRLRSTLSWLPVLAAAVATLAGDSPLLTLTPPASGAYRVDLFGLLPIFFTNAPSILFVREAVIAVALAVLAVAVVVALIRPDRGLQDRLAGTWLVPR